MEGSSRRRVLFAPVVLAVIVASGFAAFHPSSQGDGGSVATSAPTSTTTSTSSSTVPAVTSTTTIEAPPSTTAPARAIPPPTTTTSTTAEASVRAARPWARTDLYVDPTGKAAQQAYQWRDSDPDGSALMAKVAAVPQARWFVNQSKTAVGGAVDSYVSAAAAAGAMPMLVAYHIPNRDCSSYSAGGASSAPEYLAWIDGVAVGIGNRPTVVILEPDALVHLTQCLSPDAQQERLDMLHQAIVILGRNPETWVYLDAGNPLASSASTMASRLERAGVAEADGFSLNVANFQTTDANVAYGQAISWRVGGKHFVIDTSRNGAGATDDHQWCNPSGRALGATPAVTPGPTGLLDAVLWVKTPGQSDGACNGGPASGTWWPEYLRDLAQRAGW